MLGGLGGSFWRCFKEGLSLKVWVPRVLHIILVIIRGSWIAIKLYIS